MPPLQNPVRTIGLTIAGTVGSAIILAILFGYWGLWHDVDIIKTQQHFYHGPWPPILKPHDHP